MAERKADRHPVIPNGYHIPVDTDKLADFPHQDHVTIVLNDAHAGYEVFQKEIPAHLVGKTHKEKTVKWLNNFGLKHKGRVEYAADVPEYSLVLEHIEGAEYVYFDGNEIRPLVTNRPAENPGQVRATLRLGDPAVGWV